MTLPRAQDGGGVQRRDGGQLSVVLVAVFAVMFLGERLGVRE